MSTTTHEDLTGATVRVPAIHEDAIFVVEDDLGDVVHLKHSGCDYPNVRRECVEVVESVDAKEVQ